MNWFTRANVKLFFGAFSLLFLFSCVGPRSCFPNFAELKVKYPKITYLGPTKTPKVEIVKTPPPGWTPLPTVSKEAQWAILVSEDWAFYQHEGYDGKQIRDAIEKSLEEGKLKRGASTITQQVVRNIYLTKKKSLVRKIRELWMSTKIEKALGKKKILELYFNIAEWGEGVFGIHQAAQLYFGKSPSSLTAKEGAFLAMLLPSPKKYAISFRQHALTPYAKKTIHSILDKMVQAKILTVEQKEAQWSVPLSFETHQDDSTVESDEDTDEDTDKDTDEVEVESNEPAQELDTPDEQHLQDE